MMKTVDAILERIGRIGRTFWRTKSGVLVDDFNNLDDFESLHKQVQADEAMLACSLCDDGMHAPVLDIDFPAVLVPSTTDGHFHLYLDKKMSWSRYRALLDALLQTGIIQKGFHKMSLQRGRSVTLLPGMNRNEVTRGPREIS